jgi:hypothetical protein
MKKIGLIIILINLTSSSFAGEIFKIEFGKNYSSYSESELKKRVWELERAVWQLQQKVFEIEIGRNQGVNVANWICRTEAMGEKFTGTGGSRAVAENSVMEKCKASPRSNNGFHCHQVECSQ